MSLITLNQASLKLAEHIILENVNLIIHPRDKIALIGRNGAGKSTFIHMLQGEILLDSGQLQKQQHLSIAGLIQNVPEDIEDCVYHFLCRELGEIGQILCHYYTSLQNHNLSTQAECEEKIEKHHAWALLPQIEAMATHLGLGLFDRIQTLSGGMKRRALLGAALLKKPDLLILDEPTNHLDVESIEWLESYLTQYSGSVLFVTHDRAFLSQVANRIIELDRGRLYSYACNYNTYLNRREELHAAQEKEQALFEKHLKQEEAWIRQGIEARRTRNEGRVRRLKALRQENIERREAQGQVKKIKVDTAYASKIVIEAQHINYKLDNKCLIKDFSLLLTRGDKLGIIGPNGCGKTTLVRLLLGELTPESGTVQKASTLEIGYFDQLRRQLNEQETLLNNVADGADFVTINGHKRHVASYLRDFLFQPERFNQPVFSLSGGEKNRLLLAKLLAKPVNFLVMDEPTNDLDIETLEILENMLVDYSGTLILISHDRTFLNHIVSSLLVYEDGKFNEYVGGYDDYLRVKQQRAISTKKTKTSPIKSQDKSSRSKLNYQEQRELKELPAKIETLEAEISRQHTQMLESDFYTKNAQEIVAFNANLKTLEDRLAEYYVRWEELESKQFS
jgi:ABC transport system ATP-binding/permease protein